VCSNERLRRVLTAAYGPPAAAEFRRVSRGLHRAAAALEDGDLATASVETVMLRLPALDAARLAGIVALEEFAKAGEGWEDEPREPAGQADGGQWTTGGAAAGAPSSPRPSRGPTAETTAGPAEIVASASVHESRRPNENGFFPNSAGGGVYYIPSIVSGQRVRPTEIHALDASAFQVTWDNGVIRLEDRKRRQYAVAANADDLTRFNATTGRLLGVAIYAHPDEPLGAPEAPPTEAERREFERESEALEAGRQASENTLAGRITTGAVILTAGLVFAPLLPEAIETTPSLTLNLPTGTRLAAKLGALAERVQGVKVPKISVKIPGSATLRVPDVLDQTAKRLIEIKNVGRLNYTRQLRDYALWCQENGYKFYLYARKSTKFSAPLQEAIDNGIIKLRYLPQAKVRLRYIPGLK
jgi:hypothetical protein